MAREIFDAAAPQLIQQAFSKAGSWAVDGNSFIASHNAAYENWLNKVGLTLFDTTDYINPLQILFQDSVPYGSIVEMLNVEVESWINAASEDGGKANPGRNPLKHYKGDLKVFYSELAATITAPVTIYDKAAQRALISAEGAANFYAAHLQAMRRAIDLRRFMCAKQLIGNVLSEDKYNFVNGVQGVKTKRYKEIKELYDITNKDEALYVWSLINTAMNEMRVSTKDYNIAGVTGQVPIGKGDGDESPFILIARASTMAKLSTFAADIFHADSLNQNGLGIVLTDNFGEIGYGSSITFDPSDGSQTGNMYEGIDRLPQTHFLLCARDSFVVTTDWEDVESRRDTGARATTFEPQAQHHFFHVPFRPFCEFSFLGTKPVGASAPLNISFSMPDSGDGGDTVTMPETEDVKKK